MLYGALSTIKAIEFMFLNVIFGFSVAENVNKIDRKLICQTSWTRLETKWPKDWTKLLLSKPAVIKLLKTDQNC